MMNLLCGFFTLFNLLNIPLPQSSTCYQQDIQISSQESSRAYHKFSISFESDDLKTPISWDLSRDDSLYFLGMLSILKPDTSLENTSKADTKPIIRIKAFIEPGNIDEGITYSISKNYFIGKTNQENEPVISYGNGEELEKIKLFLLATAQDKLEGSAYIDIKRLLDISDIKGTTRE